MPAFMVLLRRLLVAGSLACLSAGLSPARAFAQDAGQALNGPDQSQAQPPDQAPPPTAAPPTQQSPLPARLSDVEGSVRLVRVGPAQPAAQPAAQGTGQIPPPPPADEVFRQATVNMPVLAGMKIETGDDGRAELEFNDGSIARLTPNSVVALVSLDAHGEQLRAVRGLSYYELPGQSISVLSVEAGPDQVRLEPNTLLRADLDSAPYQVGVLRGSAHFNNPALDIGFEVNTGETASLDPTSPTAYDLKQDLAQNSWDAWNSDRDSTLAQLADGETNARVGNGGQDSEAWNDLDYYGSWYNVPGAGMAWAPDGVDASFDPYGQGAWGYYSGIGYTWVSSYPWGWLPYHCGGWSYFNGFGWGWQPGSGCGGFGGVGWYPYTGVHHRPPGYRIPPHPVPLDPRLRTHLGGVPLPHAQPLRPVERGQSYRFRQVGGTRPEPRAFPLSKTASASGSDSGDGGAGFAPVLPIVSMQQYRNGLVGGGLQGEHIERGRTLFTPGQNTIAPLPGVIPRQAGPIAPLPGVVRSSPGVIAAPPRVIPLTPHYSAPAPHYSAPTPHYAAPAPHVSAPAPAARGH